MLSLVHTPCIISSSEWGQKYDISPQDHVPLYDKGKLSGVGLTSSGEAFESKFLWLVPEEEVRDMLLLDWKRKQLPCCETLIRPHGKKQLKAVLSQHVARK